MDALNARAVPSSAEAEQAVIGSMLIDADCIALVIEQLRANDFYFPQNRAIFETFVSMFLSGETIDPVTVLEKLKENGLLMKPADVPISCSSWISRRPPRMSRNISASCATRPSCARRRRPPGVF